jgi:hypothetical protein
MWLFSFPVLSPVVLVLFTVPVLLHGISVSSRGGELAVGISSPVVPETAVLCSALASISAAEIKLVGI